MAEKTNKVFISFALRDIKLRDQLFEQLNKEQTTFSFVDMPVKQSWEPAWKEECRAKVTGCDGVIAIITKNVVRADGQLWEIRCAGTFAKCIHSALRNALIPNQAAPSVIFLYCYQRRMPGCAVFLESIEERRNGRPCPGIDLTITHRVG